jgi:ABC-type multidrug transport system fused ATPase/permease subunit
MSFAGSRAGVANAFGTMLNAGLSLTALVLGSVLINPVATVVVLGALTILGSILAPVRRRIRSRGRELTVAQMDFATSVGELGTLGMEMQAFGVREQFGRRVDGLIVAYADRVARARIAQGSLTPLYTAMAFAAIVGGLALASAFEAGELGGVAAVMLVMLRSLSYGQAVQSASGSLAGLAPYLEMIDDTIGAYREQPAELGSVAIPGVGAISADDVSFSYADGRPVLHGLSFRIQRGEVIGVVGPSGGGKTTLVQLLLGLRNPTSGRIAVADGVDLRDVDRRSWTDLTAFPAAGSMLIASPMLAACPLPVGLRRTMSVRSALSDG